MSEENKDETIKLNAAARDVVAERLRQIRGEGYTTQRDDRYINNELADAASVYARLAGRPGQLSTDWPFDGATLKLTFDRRRDLVKAAALLLAEIERIDRQALIQPLPVARDSDGKWTHPGLPSGMLYSWSFENTQAWFEAQQLERCWTAQADEVSAEQRDKWVKKGDFNAASWEPTKPFGNGWFMLSLHNSENGPVCWWARRMVESCHGSEPEPQRIGDD